MEILELTSVPLIVSVVYGTLALYKAAVKTENLIKLIPLIAVLLGAALGVIIHLAEPAAMPAGNVFMAILIGGASGLAATGTNQIFKQLTKKEAEKTEAVPEETKPQEIPIEETAAVQIEILSADGSTAETGENVNKQKRPRKKGKIKPDAEEK